MKERKIQFIDLPELFHIRIVKGKDISHHFKPHFHRTYNIGIITAGKVQLKINNQQYSISQGELFLINPNIPHEFEIHKNSKYSHYVICLKEKMMDTFIRSYNKNSFQFDQIKISNNSLYQRINNTFEIILDESRLMIEKEELLIKLLELVLKEAGTLIEINETIKSDKIYQIEKVREYINNNWKQDLTLEHLSKVANMSKFHFSRVFKKVIGLSPYDYFLQLKIKEVQKLLEERSNITEIAYETGFYDQSHLNKYFNKFVGISPSEYMEYHKKI
ncbi:MAG: AraC family transcriptional regulator [Marinisporobacter sp.]|jgi:AraC-like DNA-binding protein|nr:AraC family transcriptional regulator [Marinisporobacter sp.]